MMTQTEQCPSPAGSRTARLAAAALLVVATIAPSASYAQRALANRSADSASGLLERLARLDVANVSLEDALKRLAERSRVEVAFSPTRIPRDLKVSCSCRDVSVTAALNQLLARTGLSYAELDGQVVIFLSTPYHRGPDPSLAAPSAMSYTSSRLLDPSAAMTGLASAIAHDGAPQELLDESQQQAASISGTVVDTRGRPLQNASVSAAGSSPVLTDAAGRFRLERLSGTTVTIRATMIGYRPLTTSARVGSTDLRLELAEAPLNLDEIVVTGTAGGAQRRAIGNAVTKLDMTEVNELAPPRDIQTALSTRVPGLRIMRASGDVGTGGNSFIRGASSIALSNEPLLYVDGVRVDNTAAAQSRAYVRGDRPSRINDLNPDEIESIEVIKGPAAATLYGTEASNGVIQITTKRGSRGKPRVEMSVKQGANFLHDPVGKFPRSFFKDPSGAIQSYSVLQDDLDHGFGSPFSTGHAQSYGLNVSGGAEQLRYYTAVDFDRDVGILDWNWQNKFSGRTNITYSFSPKLEAIVSLGAFRNRLRTTSPVQPFIYNIIWATPATRNTVFRGYQNRLPEQDRDVVGIDEVSRTLGSLQLTHHPLGWLTQRLTVGVDLGDARSSALFPRDSLGGAGPFGAASLGRKLVGDIRTTYTTLDYNLTGRTKLGSALMFSTSAGLQYYIKSTYGDSTQGDVFPVRGVETVSATTTRTASEDFTQNKSFGAFVQEQIAWRDRLFLTTAFRGDDNSAFGTNYDFVLYPKVSVSWVLSEEPFLSKSSFINTAKVRAAWGRAGQQPDVFASSRLYAAATGRGAIPTLTPLNIGNPNLKPEVGEELELGFDATLFGDRVSLEFTHYRKTTRDAIVAQQVHPSAGFPGTRFVNLGKIRNRGVELAVNATPVRGRSLSWDVGLNVATNHNLIVDLGGVSLPPFGTLGRQGNVQGFPAGGIYGFRVLSAEFDANGKVINGMCEGGAQLGGGGAPVPCTPTSPFSYYGTPTPTWFGSASSIVTIGAFRLLGIVDFTGGNIREDGDLAIAHSLFNLSEVAVRKDNPIVEQYRLLASIPLELGYVKAGFAKLRTLSGSYTIPASFARRFLGASAGSITASADNVATLWWAQRGTYGRNSVDPEVKTNNGLSGLDAFNQEKVPPFTRFALSLRLTF